MKILEILKSNKFDLIIRCVIYDPILIFTLTILFAYSCAKMHCDEKYPLPTSKPFTDQK